MVRPRQAPPSFPAAYADHMISSVLAWSYQALTNMDRGVSQRLTPQQVAQIMYKKPRIPSGLINAAMRLICSVERR
jgi:hypothetical protein